MVDIPFELFDHIIRHLLGVLHTLIVHWFYAQLSSRREENTFHSWIYYGIKTWTVYIWCVSICSYNCPFWGDDNSNFYLKWLISFLTWCLFRMLLLLLHILCILLRYYGRKNLHLWKMQMDPMLTLQTVQNCLFFDSILDG